jgi:hypothetical protein
LGLCGCFDIEFDQNREWTANRILDVAFGHFRRSRSAREEGEQQAAWGKSKSCVIKSDDTKK